MRFSRSHCPFFLGSSLSLLSFTLAIPYVHDSRHNLSCQGITTSPGIEAFVGVPYGASTSGSNRFASPVPFLPSLGYTFNATSPGHSCPQNVAESDDPESVITDIDEDCLNLNVARPAARRDGELLLVMVWVYGGTFLSFWAGFSFKRIEKTADTSRKAVCKAVQPMLGQQLQTG